MKRFGIVALVVLLAALGVVVTITFAAPPTTPTVDGSIANDNVDWDSDELLVDDAKTDSAWGSNNDLDNLYVTWDANNLYVGVSGTLEVNNNAAIVYIDTGVSGGETDFSSASGFGGAYPRNFNFSGRDIDLMLARWGHNAAQVYTVTDNVTIDVSGLVTVANTSNGTSLMTEYAVPWSLLGNPYGSQICLVAVIAGGDNWNGPDSMPDNAGMDGSGSPTTLSNLACIDYAYTDLRISEIRMDQPGADDDEYFELAGPANTALDGLTYVVIGDGTGASGVIEAVVDLTGQSLDANGFFVAAESTFSLGTADLTTSINFENSDNLTHLLVTGFTGADGNDLDTNDDGVLDVTPWAGIVDLIATIEEQNPPSGTEYHYGPPTVGPDGTFAPGHAFYCPAGWQIGVFDPLGGDDTPGAANAPCPTLASELVVTKAGPATAVPGDALVYDVTIDNTGSTTATNVVLTDTLPVSTTYVADNIGTPTNPAAGVYVWSLGDIPAGGSASYQITAGTSAAINLGTLLTNTVAVSTDEPGDTPAGNADTAVTLMAVPPSVILSVAKSGPAYGIIGGVESFPVAIRNSGTVTAQAVVFTDTLPAGASYAGDDSGVTPTNPAPGVYVWSLGDLPPQSAITATVFLTIDTGAAGGTVLTNTAEVSTASAGDDPADNVSQAATTVFPPVTTMDVQQVPDPAVSDASPYAGQTVWVEGVVTSPPGEIDVSQRLMVIEDPAGGPWSGLFAFRSANFQSLPAGTHVRLLGMVEEYFGQTQLQMSSGPWAVEVLGTLPVPAPVVLNTGQFDDVNPAVSEQWEAVLVEFQNATVTNDNLGFSEWYFDDGSGNARADDLGDRDGNLTYVPNNGDEYQYIRGIGSFSFNNYKLLPRSDADIALLVVDPIFSKDAPVLVAPGSLFTYTITLQNLTGLDLNNTVISDTLPAGATFAYALDGGSLSGGDVVWNLGTVPNNSTVQVRFAVTATLSAGTTIVNDAYTIRSTEYPIPVAGAPVATVVNTALSIHDIQGARHYSLLAGQPVQNVVGIVTVVDGSDFYMQEPNPDGDVGTSEGIFVDVSGSASINVGDEVQVSGVVAESYPGGDTANLSTTLIDNASVAVLSSGNALPAPVVVGQGGRVPPTMVIDDDANGNVNTGGSFDPTQDGIDFYESMEGMLLQVNDALVVGINRFGEIAVVGDDGQFASTLTPRGGIVIQPDDYNPERIIIDDLLVAAEPDVNIGDTLPGVITGVLSYDFGNFKLLNPAPLPPVVSGGLTQETTTLSGTADHLRVATFNVENLDPGDPQAKFDALGSQIANNLAAPDIIVLEEIQDNNGETNDGTVDASLTYQTLITAIVAAGGPTYEYRDIAPQNNQDGGAPGANIRVGFLFNPARVSFVDRAGGTATAATTVTVGATGALELSYSPGRIDPTAGAFDDSRKPLVGEFRFNGHPVFVIGNHFNSKGGDSPLFGSFQPPILASEAQRLQQAQVVNDFVDSILALDPNANVIVAGDLNDFQFSPPLMVLEGGVLKNLIELLPVAERYTYVYDGNSQALDHILVSGNLLGPAQAEVDVVHTNAEFDTDFRYTDHDPVLAQLLLPLPAVTITMPADGAALFALNGTDADVVVEVATSDGWFIPTSGHWHYWVDGTMLGPVYGYTTTVNLAVGTHVISAELRSLAGMSLATDSVTVTVDTRFEGYLPVVVRAPASAAAAETPAAPAAASAAPGGWTLLAVLPAMLIGLPLRRPGRSS
ncbi:MAG: DUF11 domain-containing protein [Anaerolineales bacterium]|nr:DUF11 domain-containing protein [Anaerolineales bacterium]